MKSVYNLDFLGLTSPVVERKLESLMIAKIKDLLMELGHGFCFIGNQYSLSLNNKRIAGKIERKTTISKRYKKKD